MSAADWWRTGYGHDFAMNVERIAASLEKISKSLDKIERYMNPMEYTEKLAHTMEKHEEPKGEDDG